MNPDLQRGLQRFARLFVLLAALFQLSFPLNAGRYFASEYIVDSWETEDGLPENSATAMVQAPDGYLWFSTFGGLVRYNGKTFTVFDQSNIPELPSSGIVNIHLDSTGCLWVSTLRGLLVSEPGQFTKLHKAKEWTGDFVRTFSEHAGRICLTSFNGKVFEFANERLAALPDPPGKNGEGYFGYVDPKGTIWAVQNGFFGHWNGEHWLLAESAPSVTNDFQAATTARDGTLLVLGESHLLRLHGEKILSERKLTQSISTVWRIDEHADGNVWISTYVNGLSRLDTNGVLQTFTSTNGLTYNSTRFALEDRERNLWVGTSGGGLMKFKKRSVLSCGTEEGLPERNVKAVVQDANGSILVGMYGGGIVRLKNSRASDLCLEGSFVQCLLSDRKGRLWVGTFGKGLHRFDREGRDDFASDRSCGDRVSAIFEDSRSSVWIGGSKGVSIAENGAYSGSTSNGSPIGVYQFAQDPTDSSIWAAAPDGLYRFSSNTWQAIPTRDSGISSSISCLYFESDGTLWAGTTASGLFRFRLGHWTQISEDQGLSATFITSILQDAHGDFWFGSNRGIFRASGQNLNQVADGRAPRLAADMFTQSDGLPSVECAGGFQSTSVKDSNGRLWFATLKGAVMIDPENLYLNTNPPPIFLEKIRFIDGDGQRHSFSPTPKQRVRFPPGSQQFEAHFAVLSYSAPENVTIRSKLFLDGRLVDSGTEKERIASSRWLPPGNYSLEVTASNNDGVWNHHGATLAFAVEPFLWQTSWFRFLVAGGSLAGVSCVSWFLTRKKLRRQFEQLQQQRVLEHERARLATILEATSDFVGFAAPDGRALFVNAAGRRMLGIAPDAPIQSLTIRDFHPAQAASNVRNALEVAHREGTWSGENFFISRNGREIPVSQVIVMHKDSDGNVGFFSTIARDITERKNAEQALRDSEARLRTLTEATFEGIGLSKNGLVFDVNDQLAGMLGYIPQELIGKPVMEFVAPESRETVRQKMLEDSSEPYEHLAVRKDGRVFPVEVCSRSSVLGNERIRVAAVRDITERKRLEEHIRQTQKMESIGQLAGGVAHDFNNILTVIQGYSLMILSNPGATDTVVESGEQIALASERAANLTRQLLTFSRNQVMQQLALDLNQAVSTVAKMLERILGEDINLVVSKEPELPLIKADAGMIDQVLMNLSVNARDAMPKGGTLTISTRSEFITAADIRSSPEAAPGAYVCLTVEDTGCGIPQEIRSRIIEPFFTTKGPGKGTGLGLSTVYAIVRQHRGWLTIESEVGKGSRFKVYLPEIESFPEKSENDDLGLISRGRGETILLVEDEFGVRALARSVLRKYGYIVLEAASGPAALELWKHNQAKISLAIIDMIMPGGMTGPQLADKLHEDVPDLPVIYCSGYSSDHAGDLNLREGSNFLSKPYTPQSIAQIVSNALKQNTTA